MKSKLIKLSLCIIFGVLMIVAIFLYSKEPKNNNNFIRLFPSHFLTNWKGISIGSTPFYILGVVDSMVYIGNPAHPLLIKKVNYHTGTILNHDINISNKEKIAWSLLKTHINATGIYLSEGLSPTILYGNLHSLELTRQAIDTTIRFSRCLPLSPSSYILTTFDPHLKQNILVKQTLDPILSTPITKVLEKQIDGFFCTDGDLHYCQETNRLIYVYRYRNEYLYLDNNLNIIYKGKTIDNIGKAQIKIIEVGAGNMKHPSLAAPPLIVNAKSYVFGNRLFIHSNLRSKNEEKRKFHENSVIDIYSLKHGTYEHSFYIPPYHDKPMQNFAIFGNTLIVLYEQYIVTFDMSFSQK